MATKKTSKKTWVTGSNRRARLQRFSSFFAGERALRRNPKQPLAAVALAPRVERDAIQPSFDRAQLEARGLGAPGSAIMGVRLAPWPAPRGAPAFWCAM